MRPIRSVSVLMPTFRGMEFLERVLAALAAQKCALPWDFRAIDSSSDDGTWEALGRWAERFPVPFARERIEGVEFDHGDTRNLLAARSTGDLLVFLTQDAIPAGPDWLATLVANFQDDSVGAVYCRNVPRPDAHLLTKVFSQGDMCYQAGRREVRLPDAATYARMNPYERRVLWNFNDVASALRRELWERHPFPRTWFGEDVLQARAVLEAGYTVVYDDVATVEHSHDYGPEETYARAKIDGAFNAEWLGRTCVASKGDARILEKRVLEQDALALKAAGLSDAELGAALVEAARLRGAAFDGLHDGGRSDKRYPATRMLGSTRLKVLYVAHGFPPDTWAGAEIYTLNIAREIRSRGHEVVILARAPAAVALEDGGPPDFSVEEREFEGLRVLRMTNRLNHRRLRDSFADDRADAVFRRVLEFEAPDVVHFQHLIHLSAGIVRVAREEGVPSILTLHDYWALCARVQLIRPDAVRCEENQGAGCFLCVKDKHLEAIGAARVAGAALGSLAELAAGLAGRDEYKDIAERHSFVPAAYARADLRVSPSRFLRTKFVETAGFDPHTLVYSANGMRTDHVRFVDKKPDPQGRVRFGFVGSLVWYKGGATMVRAMQRLAGEKCVLNVFGDFKPETDEHHAELRALAGPNVEFRGRFDNSRLADVYAQIDVLIVPSVWFENAPITIHEAHLLRTPVVASGIGGMAEFVRDGVDGLHFRVGDHEDLAQKLLRFVREPGLAASLSKDFPLIKTIRQDAEATEFRYRQLACLAAARGPGAGERVIFDATGVDTSMRAGGAEPQGADMLLLRATTGAAAEYDLSGAGGGRRRVRVEQFALAAEGELDLGLRVLVDGRHAQDVGPFRSEGRDGAHEHVFEVDLPREVRRLRLEPLRVGALETHARIRRVQVLRVVRAREAADASAPRGDGA